MPGHEDYRGNPAAQKIAEMTVAADHGKAMDEKEKDAAKKEKEEEKEDAS